MASGQASGIYHKRAQSAGGHNLAPLTESCTIDPKNLIDSDFCDLSDDSAINSSNPALSSRRCSIDSLESTGMARGIFNLKNESDLKLVSNLM
jgi:hypothetical protein